MRFDLALPAVVLCSVAGGCLPWLGAVEARSGAVGSPSNGMLVAPVELPRQGAHYQFYRPTERRYGVPELVGAVSRAAARIDGRFPGTVLLVGDLSAREGGFIGGHRSHRTGVDVDFAFFTTDLGGRRRPGHPLTPFDRFGVAVRAGKPARFDVPRNWELVEALLSDEEAAVQWIFVSDGLKALLLEWALAGNRDTEIVQRAALVLHQPGDSAPHDDHFHVRVFCPPAAVGTYCAQAAPVWLWVARSAESRIGLGREELVRLALEGL